MRSLSANVARLSALRSRSPFQLEIDNRLIDLKHFGSNPGALKARTYFPENLPPNAPLVVVLHGCTQSAAGYDYCSGWSRLADRHGFALLFPQQQASNNPNLCFNWFVPEDTRRDYGETLSIRQMIENLLVTCSLDPDRVFITGLSAGGAMTSVMLAAYPEIFAGGGIIAGLPFSSVSTIPEAFEMMRGQSRLSKSGLRSLVKERSLYAGPWPTISVWHGSADATVNPSNATAIIDQWRYVHGLGETPSGIERVDGQRRRVWRSAEGKVLIEEFIIAGMGHGTPLKTGPGGLGNAGPFMLDAGISSTCHIARFWGLLKTDAMRKEVVARADVKTGACDYPRGALAKSLPPPGGLKTPMSSDRIRTVIEDALRKAGLMR